VNGFDATTKAARRHRRGRAFDSHQLHPQRRLITRAAEAASPVNGGAAFVLCVYGQ